MQFYHCILTLVLLQGVFAGYNNVTGFWQNMLNETSMHFQAYTGNSFFIQVMKKLTGTIPKIKAECIIVCSVQLDISWAVMNLLMGFL